MINQTITLLVFYGQIRILLPIFPSLRSFQDFLSFLSSTFPKTASQVNIHVTNIRVYAELLSIGNILLLTSSGTLNSVADGWRRICGPGRFFSLADVGRGIDDYALAMIDLSYNQLRYGFSIAEIRPSK